MSQKQHNASFGEDLDGLPKPTMTAPKGASSNGLDFGALLKSADMDKDDTKEDLKKKPKRKVIEKVMVKETQKVICPICGDPSCYLSHEVDVEKEITSYK